ncbi:MAG TPA: PQQ-dependent sugar dehydrogenase [Bacteroidia bacterium]|jgi:glucose/arabinose dehydrogenase|nr:PQQ-dependent sugar dehydrogenase [Bacteroidia bacterium]
MKTKLTLLLLFPLFLHAQTYWIDTLCTGLLSPVAFDITPDGRIFLTQKGGQIAQAYEAKIKVYALNGNFISEFYDLTDSVDSDFERGLLGIAVDPDFTNTHYIYCFYVHRFPSDEHFRIMRFTDVNSTGTNPTVIYDIDVPDNLPGVHIGGNIHFRPSEPDKIYFTIGDVGSDQLDTALNYAHMLTNPYGKTLRINKDGTIPTDNPFYDDGNISTGNCDIIWSYEHRNPFDFCFSPVNDSFYSSENGLNTWDEVNLIHKGKSYGWNECEGFYRNSSNTILCDDTTSVLPLTAWGAPLGAVTGILFYSGTVMPEFDNHLLVANNDYGEIWDLTMGNAPYFDTVTTKQLWMDATTTGGLTTLKEGPEGCVYAMNGGYTNNGAVIRICPSWMDVEEQHSSIGFIGQNFPNPCTGETNFRFYKNVPGTVELTVYDLQGKETGISFSRNCVQGENEIHLNVGQLVPGNYFVRISSVDGNAGMIITVGE